MTTGSNASSARCTSSLCGAGEQPNGKHGHVIDYRHVIHSLRRKPMALLA
jgi:hypothetical protein